LNTAHKPFFWLAATLVLAATGVAYIFWSSAQLANDTRFDASMRRTLVAIVCAGLSGLLFTFYVVHARYRFARQRLNRLVNLDNAHLLEIQTQTNQQLLHVNQALQDNERRLAGTLQSMSDAVITTDAQAHITLLNPAAEAMCGWTHAQSLARPVEEIFCIVHKDSRQPATIPIAGVLAHGISQGLAGNTTLIARDHREYDIAGTCSPMRGNNAEVTGAVLVFRNATEECALQQSCSDSSALEALREAGALQNAIFNSADFSSIATDAQGVIQIFNVGAERLLGYSALEVINKITPAEISDPQELVAHAAAISTELGTVIAPGFEALVFKASRGIEDIYELTYIRKDPVISQRWCQSLPCAMQATRSLVIC